MRRALLAGLVLGIYAICLPASASAEAGHPEEVKPVSWTVGRVEGPKTFWARGPKYGSCGGPAPSLEPMVQEQEGRAEITLVLHIPEAPERKGPIYCPADLLILGAKIQLNRPLCDVSLYDGSTTPPSQRSLPQPDPYCKAATATYWQRCEGVARLKVHHMPCRGARSVLSRFFHEVENFDLTPSPPGWACKQRNTGPDYESPHRVTCHGAAKKNLGRRLNYLWGAGSWPQTPVRHR